MRLFLCSILLLVTTLAQSQLKPDFFPEDILSEEGLGAKCYCKPGVANKSKGRGLSIIYGIANSGDYTPAGTPSTFSPPVSSLNRLNQFEFKIKIPVLLKERTKILLGYKYYTEWYNFERIGIDFSDAFRTLDALRLKNNDYNVILSHSLNEKNYLIFRYKYATNGNYEGWTSFENRYAVHSFLATYGIKKSEDFEWGFGFFYTKSFRETFNFPFPFFLYNRTFNAKWGMEAMFPANIFMRYNMDAESLLIFGTEYKSKSFRLDVTDSATTSPLDYAYNHAEILLDASWERHLFSWFWLNIKAGYQFNLSSEFESKAELIPDFVADPGSGFFINFGLFISPDLNKHEHKSILRKK